MIKAVILRDDGRGQRLERAHSGLAGSLPEDREVPEELAARHAELRDLNEAQAKGEEEPRATEQRDQELWTPQETVRVFNPLQKLREERGGQDAVQRSACSSHLRGHVGGYRRCCRQSAQYHDTCPFLVL